MADAAPGSRVTAGDRARLLRAALARRAGEPGAGGVASSPAATTGVAPRPPGRRTAPASYAQEQLWFLDRLAPGNANYNVPFAFAIDGPLDVPALRVALASAARRHESLRTALRADPGGLVQVIEPDIDVTLEATDLRAVADPAGEAWRRCRQLVAEHLPLDRAPLWRATLLRIGDGQHLLVWVASHAVADGWSVGLLSRELATGYRAARHGGADLLPAPPMQFADYARQQRETLTTARIAELVAFWEVELAGSPVLAFPFDHPRPPLASSRGATHTFPIPAPTVEAVRSVGRRLGCTPFTVVFAAYQALLARYCASTDVVVGTPVAGRDRSGYDDLMGSLVNTVAVRGDMYGDPTFADLVTRTAARLRAALDHQDLPFGLLVEHLRPPRDGRYNPVCQTVFSFGNTPHTDHEYVLDDGVRFRPGGVSNGTVRFDLELAVDDEPAGWTGRLEYATDLVDEPAARLLCDRYRTLLAEAADDPDRRLSRLLVPDQPRPAADHPAPPGARTGTGADSGAEPVPVTDAGVTAMVTAWVASRPVSPGRATTDPIAVCARVSGVPGGLAALHAAARSVAGALGLPAGGSLACAGPLPTGSLAFAVLLAATTGSDLDVERAANPTAEPPDLWLVPAGEPAAPAPPARRVLLLADRPGTWPAWTVPAGATTWAVTIPPAAPGTTLGHPVRDDESRFVLGSPLPGTRAEVVDGDGRPALAGTVGRLRLAVAGTDPARARSAEPGWPVHQLADGRLAAPGRATEPRPAARVTAPAHPARDRLVGYLLALWRDALDRPDIDPGADFFELGGHSLLAGELVERIRTELHCELALVEFFQTLTVRDLADLLATRTARVPAPDTAPHISAELLDSIEEMSDDDVVRMLRRTSTGTPQRTAYPSPGADA